MYKKNFEIRWSDIDANGHLANSAYTNFMSHTRMGFFIEYGFSMETLSKHGVGPVVFYEHTYYYKESFIGKPVTVSLELSGLSEDGMFFKFEHNFYNDKGEHLASSDMLGAWIDLKTRKLTTLPEALLKFSQLFPRTKNFKTLTKEDTRVEGKVPKNLS
ncbi:acyl-CoA thioesterase [Psychroserpens algicola]|uniref:acyl-CoA thioesterase n=1 Tax=Psychroserpens algicola TaxID=1719034 RepID=UPI0019546079|nr:thioesterase family protein [Psychroserpens algicola]